MFLGSILRGSVRQLVVVAVLMNKCSGSFSKTYEKSPLPPNRFKI